MYVSQPWVKGAMCTFCWPVVCCAVAARTLTQVYLSWKLLTHLLALLLDGLRAGHQGRKHVLLWLVSCTSRFWTHFGVHDSSTNLMFTLGSCHGVLPFTSALDSPKGSDYVLLLVIHFSHINVYNISHWKDKSHCPVIIVECSLKTIPLWLCLSALMTLSSLGLVYQTLCTLFVLLVSVILTRFPFMFSMWPMLWFLSSVLFCNLA